MRAVSTHASLINSEYFYLVIKLVGFAAELLCDAKDYATNAGRDVRRNLFNFVAAYTIYVHHSFLIGRSSCGRCYSCQAK